MGFIHIVDETDTITWQPESEDGTKLDSVLTLQVLSDKQLSDLRKRHNKTAFKHGQRVEDFDSFGFTNDVVDAAIVGWTGVFRGGTDDPLPCTREVKLRLPERLKIEVVRLCAGREAGRLYEGGAAESKKS